MGIDIDAHKRVALEVIFDAGALEHRRFALRNAVALSHVAAQMGQDAEAVDAQLVGGKEAERHALAERAEMLAIAAVIADSQAAAKPVVVDKAQAAAKLALVAILAQIAARERPDAVADIVVDRLALRLGAVGLLALELAPLHAAAQSHEQLVAAPADDVGAATEIGHRPKEVGHSKIWRGQIEAFVGLAHGAVREVRQFDARTQLPAPRQSADVFEAEAQMHRGLGADSDIVGIGLGVVGRPVEGHAELDLIVHGRLPEAPDGSLVETVERDGPAEVRRVVELSRVEPRAELRKIVLVLPQMAARGLHPNADRLRSIAPERHTVGIEPVQKVVGVENLAISAPDRHNYDAARRVGNLLGISTERHQQGKQGSNAKKRFHRSIVVMIVRVANVISFYCRWPKPERANGCRQWATEM